MDQDDETSKVVGKCLTEVYWQVLARFIKHHYGYQRRIVISWVFIFQKKQHDKQPEFECCNSLRME